MRQEARERETGDMACHKAFTDELAGEAKTREANDTVLGTQLQEVRAALAEWHTSEQESQQLLGKLNEAKRQEARERESGDMACRKAFTDELAGDLQEVRAALAEFATRSWCEHCSEQEFSAKRERLIGKLEAMQ